MPAATTGRSLLVIAPSAYTMGGLATWLDYLLPGLEAAGWHITLGLVSGPRHHRAAPYLEAHPFAHSLTIDCSTGTRTGRRLAIQRCLRKSQPDVLVTVNIPDAVSAAAVERRSTGRALRIVMSCHGIQQDLFNDMKHLAPALDQVICTNRLACALSVELGGISEERVHHARYGTFLPSQQRWVRERTPVVAWVGRLEQPQKRIMDLPVIAELLRGQGIAVRFLVAGAGPEESRLKHEVETRELSTYFDFKDFVAPNRLFETVYSIADAFLLTSSWETGPIVIWEAMAAGTPVVTSQYLGSGLEGLLLNEMNCLMFEPGDCASAAAQIARLISDSELHRSLVNEGSRLVKRELTCERSVAQWDSLLRGALDKEPIDKLPDEGQLSRRSGRLDRIFPPELAERIRRCSGRTLPDTGPAGEWPHTLVGDVMDEGTFWQLAQLLDVRPEARVQSKRDSK